MKSLLACRLAELGESLAEICPLVGRRAERWQHRFTGERAGEGNVSGPTRHREVQGGTTLSGRKIVLRPVSWLGQSGPTA
jgi:hypothetical protein